MMDVGTLGAGRKGLLITNEEGGWFDVDGEERDRCWGTGIDLVCDGGGSRPQAGTDSETVRNRPMMLRDKVGSRLASAET